MSPEQRARDFRNQASSYRQTASVVTAEEWRDTYLGWADDLDGRAGVIEAEIELAARDSGSDRQGGDPPGAPGEASQSGGAEGAASPTLSSRNPETPNDR